MATKKIAKKKVAKKAVKKAVKKKATKKAVKKKTVKKKAAKKTVKKKPAVKKKAVKKKAAKKKTVKKKPAKKKKAAKKAPGKAVKKAVKKLKKSQGKQDAEIAKLQSEVAKLKLKKKGKNTKHVSEYNLFIRKQIKSGLTFSQATKEWGKYQKLLKTPKRKQTAYNQFIGSQMKLGKTWNQAVALWKLAKAGKLGKKGTTKMVTKTIVRRVKSKPQIITRTRRIKSKPTVIIRRVKSKPKTVTRTVTKNVGITKTQIEGIFDASDEEIAFNVIETYFKELARVGFKKQLSLDEVINSYLYALARVKRDDIEMSEVANAVKKARLRK